MMQTHNPQDTTRPTCLLLIEYRAPCLVRLLRLLMQMLRHIQNRLDVVVIELLLALACQQLRRLEHVLDLPAVDLHSGELAQVLLCDLVLDLARGRLQFRVFVEAQEVLPDGLAAFSVEIGVVERDVDATAVSLAS